MKSDNRILLYKGCIGDARSLRRRWRVKAAFIWALRAAGIAFLLAAVYLALTVEEAPCVGEETAHERAWRLGRSGW